MSVPNLGNDHRPAVRLDKVFWVAAQRHDIVAWQLPGGICQTSVNASLGSMHRWQAELVPFLPGHGIADQELKADDAFAVPCELAFEFQIIPVSATAESRALAADPPAAEPQAASP